ncbi:interferon lambda receptor 1 [Garra rufa]|uniref:interferon lambda receptor 1 n=1 Tax=Garra rufa TaxID=137080 RepID=UPI003CCEF244
MTNVMTHVKSDVTSKYHVKISAGGQCLGEVKFFPFWQTTFSAPQLAVTSNQTYLNVTVLPPMAAWNCSIENIKFWGIGLMKPSIKYTVRLTQPESEAGKVVEETSRSMFIWLREMDVQYCGEVLYTLTHPGRASPSEHTSFCVIVSGPNSWIHIILWPGLLALLLLIVLPIILCQLFVTGKHSFPNSLILPKKSILPFGSDPRDDISKVEVWPGFATKHEQQAVFPPRKPETAGYASQDPCDHEWVCDQLDIPIPDSAESSVHYSTIQMSSKPLFNGTTDETSSDSFGPDSISTFLTSHSDTGSSSGPLVVPVRPAENGALQFHDGLFQYNTGQSSPAPSQDSEGLTGERIPLLSDLIQKDSRCNSSNLPAHVSDVGTSNYRPNLLPGIPLEGQQDQRTYIMRTDPTEPDEDFTDEEEPRVGVIFLERWKGLSLSCN